MTEQTRDATNIKGTADVNGKKSQTEQNAENGTPLRPNTYWLTRIVLLRFLAFIYFVAFLVALFQNKALIGHHGILPADQFLSR